MLAVHSGRAPVLRRSQSSTIWGQDANSHRRNFPDGRIHSAAFSLEKPAWNPVTKDIFPSVKEFAADLKVCEENKRHLRTIP